MVKRLAIVGIVSIVGLTSVFAQGSSGQQNIYYTALSNYSSASGTIVELPKAYELGQSSHQLLATISGCTASQANYVLRLQGSFDDVNWNNLGGLIYDNGDLSTPSTLTTTKFFYGVYPFIRVNLISPPSVGSGCAITVNYIGSFNVNPGNIKTYQFNVNTHTQVNYVGGNNLAGFSYIRLFTQNVQTVPITISVFSLQINNQSTGNETITFGPCYEDGGGTHQGTPAWIPTLSSNAVINAGTVYNLPISTYLYPYFTATYQNPSGSGTGDGICVGYGATTPNHSMIISSTFEVN